MANRRWEWSLQEVKIVDHALLMLIETLYELRLISRTAKQHAVSCQTRLLETDEEMYGDY